MPHDITFHVNMDAIMTDTKPTIFTYGNTNITALELILLVQPYGINCIVDCRPHIISNDKNNCTTNELKLSLKQNNIAYLPFYEHFGIFPQETKNRQGEIVYKKAVLSDNFLTGIERLRNGVNKGFRICIINNEPYITNSQRFLLIGRYLTESYNIIHIISQHKHITQQQAEQKKEEIDNKKRLKKQKAEETGKKGELLAANYLTMNGYRILDMNWNLHHGCELDIVAIREHILHFIEVKTRTTDKYGEPEEAINYKKLKNIYKACQNYRYQKRLYKMEYQLDSIAIIYHNDEDYTLRHFLDIRTFNQACAQIITYSPNP